MVRAGALSSSLPRGGGPRRPRPPDCGAQRGPRSPERRAARRSTQQSRSSRSSASASAPSPLFASIGAASGAIHVFAAADKSRVYVVEQLTKRDIVNMPPEDLALLQQLSGGTTPQAFTDAIVTQLSTLGLTIDRPIVAETKRSAEKQSALDAIGQFFDLKESAGVVTIADTRADLPGPPSGLKTFSNGSSDYMSADDRAVFVKEARLLVASLLNNPVLSPKDFADSVKRLTDRLTQVAAFASQRRFHGAEDPKSVNYTSGWLGDTVTFIPNDPIEGTIPVNTSINNAYNAMMAQERQIANGGHQQDRRNGEIGPDQHVDHFGGQRQDHHEDDADQETGEEKIASPRHRLQEIGQHAAQLSSRPAGTGVHPSISSRAGVSSRPGASAASAAKAPTGLMKASRSAATSLRMRSARSRSASGGGPAAGDVCGAGPRASGATSLARAAAVFFSACRSIVDVSLSSRVRASSVSRRALRRAMNRARSSIVSSPVTMARSARFVSASPCRASGESSKFGSRNERISARRVFSPIAAVAWATWSCKAASWDESSAAVAVRSAMACVAAATDASAAFNCACAAAFASGVVAACSAFADSAACVVA
jgi:hypothetical protein